MRPRIILSLLVVALAGLAGSAAGQEPAPEHGHARPRLFSWVLPSDTGHYLGYYVGGGASHPGKGEQRYEHEGTWGWDYSGWLIRRRVINNWWHGQRYQGGTGAFKTDGPRLYEEK